MHTSDRERSPQPGARPALPPSRVAAPATGELAERTKALRRWAIRQPPLLATIATLPDRDEGPSDGSLCWEARAVPGVQLEGTVRVSVLRVRSLAGRRPLLVGQIQACSEADDPLPERELRWYLHRPARGVTSQAPSRDAWFTGLLDAHYELGGAVVELPASPQPEPV